MCSSAATVITSGRVRKIGTVETRWRVRGRRGLLNAAKQKSPVRRALSCIPLQRAPHQCPPSLAEISPTPPAAPSSAVRSARLSAPLSPCATTISSDAASIRYPVIVVFGLFNIFPPLRLQAGRGLLNLLTSGRMLQVDQMQVPVRYVAAPIAVELARIVRCTVGRPDTGEPVDKVPPIDHRLQPVGRFMQLHRLMVLVILHQPMPHRLTAHFKLRVIARSLDAQHAELAAGTAVLGLAN